MTLKDLAYFKYRQLSLIVMLTVYREEKLCLWKMYSCVSIYANEGNSIVINICRSTPCRINVPRMSCSYALY